MGDEFHFVTIRKIRTEDSPKMPTEEGLRQQYRGIGFSEVELRRYGQNGIELPSDQRAVYAKS